MSTYSCIIIEDEPLALERTQLFVEKVPTLSLIGTFDNALKGLAFLQQQSTDILFLDVKMDELSGIELLESVTIESQVIFTTAYQEYALKGYELNITDYLLKPFTFQRFLQAVNKAQQALSTTDTTTPRPDFTFIKTENRLEKIMFNDILFIEGMRDYRRIHTRQKKIMTLQTFTELMQILPTHQICRVHKSYMVAVQKIDTIERGRIRIGQQIIPISETYKTAFYQQVNLNK